MWPVKNNAYFAEYEVKFNSRYKKNKCANSISLPNTHIQPKPVITRKVHDISTQCIFHKAVLPYFRLFLNTTCSCVVTAPFRLGSPRCITVSLERVNYPRFVHNLE